MPPASRHSPGRAACALAILLVLVFLGAGCAPPQPKPPPMTQLQIRQMQTREFEVGDPLLVMKAMANVLQDLGYFIEEANSELGLMKARKEVDLESRDSYWFRVYLGQDALYRKTMIIDCSVNVSAFGKNKTRVRVIFSRKVLNQRGGAMQVGQVTNARVYQEFFAKVSKSVFIQKEKI